MISGGLQLLYLPPFSIIARFFITALAFANLGILFLFYQYFTGNFNLTPTVHIYTLGFMASTMIGALFQMLPVVAGAVIENAHKKATIVHIGLTAGTLFLTYGLYKFSSGLAFTGLVILLFTFFYIVPLMLFKLFKVKELKEAPRGFIYALFSFLIGIIFASLLVPNFFGVLHLNHGNLFNLHMSFMLYGWTAVLVASVSFQVIEMFFVTPPYPKFITKYLPVFVFGLLILKILLPKLFLVDIIIGLVFTVYAIYTITRLMSRRRKIRDPLINLWYLSMLFLILSSLFFPFRDKNLLLFLILFGIFVLSVIMSMMYRIIPFLVWMHLSTQGVQKAPTMFEVIKPKLIWWNFYIHVLSIFSLILIPLKVYFIPLIVFTLNFVFFFVNITRGVFVYIRYRKK